MDGVTTEADAELTSARERPVRRTGVPGLNAAQSDAVLAPPRGDATA